MRRKAEPMHRDRLCRARAGIAIMRAGLNRFAIHFSLPAK
jgi:hypothetical protein